MAKPSGVKITFAIDQLAEWFNKEMESKYHSISYNTYGHNRSRFYLNVGHHIFDFGSFSAMRRWMEAEIRRRRILFRRW